MLIPAESLQTLHVTPIERFWLAEDLPGSRLDFFHKYSANRPWNSERLLAALQSVAATHGLPFCRIARSPRGLPVWTLQSHVDVAEHFVDESPEPYECAPGINLSTQGGVRLWHNGSSVWFQYHHACADGRGALQFERDFFASYDALPPTDGGLPRPIPTSRTRLADAYQGRVRSTLTIAGAVIRSTYGWWYLWRYLTAVVAPFPGSTQPSNTLTELFYKTVRLDRRLTDQIIQSTRLASVTVNDRIVSATFQVLKGCVTAEANLATRFRIVVPMDMRLPSDDSLACSNKLSILYVEATWNQIDESPSFLQCIARRLRFLKRHMGLVVWRSISLGPRTIEGLRRHLDRNHTMLTCYVSNLGRVENLPQYITEFEATPTLRRHDTPFALMAYTFRHELHLTTGIDTTRIPQEVAANFVARLKERLSDVRSNGS